MTVVARSSTVADLLRGAAIVTLLVLGVVLLVSDLDLRTALAVLSLALAAAFASLW